MGHIKNQGKKKEKKKRHVYFKSGRVSSQDENFLVGVSFLFSSTLLGWGESSSGWMVFSSSTLCRGQDGGKGNRRFMSFCDTRCSRSHVNGK